MNTNLFDDAFPFSALFREQAGTLEAAVAQLAGMVDDFPAVPGHGVPLSALVAQGETTCRQIERELSLTFIQPLDREDIRELNRAFDRTLHSVGAVSSRICLYGIRQVQKGAAGQVACLVEIAAEIAPLLEVIRRAGDGAVNLDRVRKRKREADSFVLVGLGEVYETAGGSVENLLEALKWSQLYDRLEEVACCLEHIVMVIEGIIVKKV